MAAVLFSTLIDKYIMLTKKHEGKAMRKSDKMNIVDEEKTNALNRVSFLSLSEIFEVCHMSIWWHFLSIHVDTVQLLLKGLPS